MTSNNTAKVSTLSNFLRVWDIFQIILRQMGNYNATRSQYFKELKSGQVK